MKYRDLNRMKSRFTDDYADKDKHLAEWREDVFGPLSILFAVRDLLSDSPDAPKVIKFAVGGHPVDEKGGEIEIIVRVGLCDDPGFAHPLRYCGENDDPMGAGSHGVACYSHDPAENAMVILSGMPKGCIYRLAV